MGKKQSLRSKAVHLVSDLTIVLVNPISDNNNNNHNKPFKPSLPPSEEEVCKSKENESESEDSHDLAEGPDTSSFTAFLYSLLSSSDSGDNNAFPNGENDDVIAAAGDDGHMKESFIVKKGLFSRSKQSLGRAIYQAARMGGFRTQDRRNNFEPKGLCVSFVCVNGDGDGVINTVSNVTDVAVPSQCIVSHFDMSLTAD